MTDPPLAAASRYVRLVKIASGGMASVYVAAFRSTLGFRQIVALKVPHAHVLADPSYKKELLGEAHVASRLQHANVVDIRDVEETADGVTLVMDYVEGATLLELIRSTSHPTGRLPLEVTFCILADACQGLLAVHELTDDDGRPLDILHRDVTPSNVLVGVDGVARLADFGIARRHGGETTGDLKGKAGYIAPECLDGKRADGRSDVFSLAVLAWEVFAGRRLFRGESDAATLVATLVGAVPPLSTIEPQLGALGDAMFARALARDPARRTATVAEFAADLERLRRAARVDATRAAVAREVRSVAGAALLERRRRIRDELATLEAGTAPRPTFSPPVADEELVTTSSDAIPHPRATTRTRWVAVGLGVALSLVFGTWELGRHARTRDDAAAHVEPPPAAATALPPAEPAAPPAAGAISATPLELDSADDPAARPARPHPRTRPHGTRPLGSAPGAKKPSSALPTSSASSPATHEPPPNPYAQ